MIGMPASIVPTRLLPSMGRSPVRVADPLLPPGALRTRGPLNPHRCRRSDEAVRSTGSIQGVRE
jgi:hypothetical protein